MDNQIERLQTILEEEEEEIPQRPNTMEEFWRPIIREEYSAVRLRDPFPGPTRFGGSEPSSGSPFITQSLKIISLWKRFKNWASP